MAQYKILAQSPFSKPNFIVIHESSNRKTSKEIEEMIESEWEKLVKESKEQGKLLFNSSSYRLNSLQKEEDNITISLAPLDYKTKRTLVINNEKLPSEDHYANGIAIGGFVETKDEKFLFGKRNGKTQSDGKYDFIGGVADHDIAFDSLDDIQKFIQRELLEEAGIPADKIDEVKLLGIVRAPSTNIIFVCHIKLSIDSSEVNEFHKHAQDDEMDTIEIISKENLETFLQQVGEYQYNSLTLLESHE